MGWVLFFQRLAGKVDELMWRLVGDAKTAFHAMTSSRYLYFATMGTVAKLQVGHFRSVVAKIEWRVRQMGQDIGDLGDEDGDDHTPTQSRRWVIHSMDVANMTRKIARGDIP